MGLGRRCVKRTGHLNEASLLMPQTDYIVQHKDFQRHVSPFQFIAGHYANAGFGELEIPEISSSNVKGVTVARINQGRWIADCLCCNGANMLDMDFPFFMCPLCGNADNGGAWYLVKFPRNWRAIEAILLKRPLRQTIIRPDNGAEMNTGHNPAHAYIRSWEPGETLVALRAENTLLGFEA